MSLVNQQAEFMKDLAKLINFCFDQGWVITGGELFRTVEQQQIHIKAGRSKTMNSLHMKRCAVDLNFFKEGRLVWDKQQLAPIGAYWESLNPKNRWGGNFKSLVDVPHFERNV